MSAIPAGGAERLRKLARFVAIYGPSRALFKAAGRLRVRPPGRFRSRHAGIALIGCGQFAFATIGYFLHTAHGSRIAACHDIDDGAARTLASALRVPSVCASADELLATPGLRTVYIASNHASHTPYAVQALALDIDTYIEKPVAVSEAQLIELLRARRRSRARTFAGYNRPFSAAVRELRARTAIEPSAGITLQCFVAGHRIAPDHWYRRPEEGTRVCGNIGHWLDLFVHVLAWRGLPDRLDISLTWADDAEPDDNVAISIRSDRGDLFSLQLSSRAEPFEGINETICFQHGEMLARIDDFRRMTLWRGPRVFHRRYWPKDVGHRGAIAQPFDDRQSRDWHEVELSTLLMLHVTDMVRQLHANSSLSLRERWAAIERATESVGEPVRHNLEPPATLPA